MLLIGCLCKKISSGCIDSDPDKRATVNELLANAFFDDRELNVLLVGREGNELKLRLADSNYYFLPSFLVSSKKSNLRVLTRLLGFLIFRNFRAIGYFLVISQIDEQPSRPSFEILFCNLSISKLIFLPKLKIISKTSRCLGGLKKIHYNFT